MQIHELNGYGGILGSDAFLAVDNGQDTGKISVSGLLASVNNKIDNAEDELNARIDNIIAGGAAPSEAEITDARTGATALGGEVYDSLGAAIRGQATQLKNDIDRISALSVTWITGKYIWKDGGVEVTGASYKCTDYIPLNEIRKPFAYRLRVFQNAATYALYDENKRFIRSVSSSSPSIETVEDSVLPLDEGAAFIRFSTEAQGDPTVYVKSGNYGESAIGEGSITNGMIASGAVALGNLAESIIVHDDQTNFIDMSKITSGKYINASGGTTNATGYNVSDFIPLESETTYYQNKVLFTYYAFYDENKTLISSYNTLGTLASPFTTPQGTAFGRFSFNDEQIASDPWISIYSAKPAPYKLKLNNDNINTYAVQSGLEVDNPCDYVGDEIAVFNKICCIGDSITIGTFNHNEGGTEQYLVDMKYSYPTFLKKMYGVETVNLGLGGYTSVQWWTAKQNDDFGGFDSAIINLGINDALSRVPIATTETALRNIINALKSANNGIKIFLATIVPAYTDGVTTYDDVNALIRSLAQELENCYLVDLTEYSHVSKGSAYEAGHLTAIGYRRLAQDYAGYIGYIIATNLVAFKLVQFIGTNYSRT